MPSSQQERHLKIPRKPLLPALSDKVVLDEAQLLHRTLGQKVGGDHDPIRLALRPVWQFGFKWVPEFSHLFASSFHRRR